MSYEVVYTSVRRGLRTGAKGFCTVAATEGIPRALHEKLESLSGYRHTEAAAGTAPPVNHSHLIVRIQRNIYHVLSRIGDAGIDYSGRTNKIAHHLALTRAECERFRDGPVTLFADDSFWCADWVGDPDEFSPDRIPDALADPVTDFSTWEAVFGDAGWAGVLGQAVADGMKPVSIIVPNGNETLELLKEALQLVPLQLRWKLCFSTYFSRLPSGTQCHWRFVLDGTGEARRLRARSLGAIVDPTASASRPPEGNPFVEAAREGRPDAVYDIVSAAPRSRRSARIPDPVAGSSRRSGRRRRGQSPEPRVPRVTAANPFDYHEEDDATAEAVPEPKRQRRPSRMGLWLVLVLSLAVLAILVFSGIQHFS